MSVPLPRWRRREAPWSRDEAPRDRPTGELGQLLSLAAPIIVSLVAHTLMGVVDILIVGPLGTAAIAATGLGATLLMGTVLPLSAVVLGLDTEVSQAVGAGDERRATHVFAQSFYLMGGLIVMQLVLLGVVSRALTSLGVDPQVAPLAERYLESTMFGIPAMTLSYAASKFLQAHGRASSVMVIAIAGNVVNYLAVNSLVFGRFGLPALGVEGAGLGTGVSRLFMGLCYVLVLTRFPFSRKAFGFDRAVVRRLLTLGVPAGLQVMLEVWLFVVASVFMGRFEPVWLAAHNVVLQIATFTFMFPLGLSAAAAVRVGQAIGAGARELAAHRGRIAIRAGAVFMAAAGVLLFFGGKLAVAAVGMEPEIVQAIGALLGFAIFFQLFDGIQVTATGALRGLGDTHTPFLVNLLGHWLIALPAALYLAFFTPAGPRGIWTGFALGLTLVAAALWWVWQRRASEHVGGGSTPRTTGSAA